MPTVLIGLGPYSISTCGDELIRRTGEDEEGDKERIWMGFV
jgi:hypothetical protein